MKLSAKKWLIYIDLVVAALLCVVFYYIVFSLPYSVFPSPLYAEYAKLLASILLGTSISLFTMLAVDLALAPPSPLRRHHELTVPRAVKPPKPKVRALSEPALVSFVSKRRRLRGLAERMGMWVGHDVLEAAETASPYRLVARTLSYALMGFFVCVPLGVALALLYHPALLVVMVAPAIPLVYPKLKFRSAVGDRRRGLEDEIPFFSVFASILQTVGMSLYNSLTAIIGRGIFRQVEKDALLIKRDVDFFSKSPVEALEERGRIHPNEKMRTLLLGYTSEWRSGGDMAAYLEAKADDFLKDMSFRWRSYADRVTDMGEMTISLLFVFPLMVLMAAFIFPSQALTLVSLFLTLIIPAIAVSVFGVIHTIQPKNYDIIRGDVRVSVVSAAVSFVVAALLKAPIWLCLTASLAAASALYGANVLLQMREINMTEKALPQFLRDITEYRKMGYDITRALIKIAEENTYNPVFDMLLDSVSRQLVLGVRMAEVKVSTRSWLARTCFFLLGEVVESGGGTASCLEKLTNFVNHVVRVKRETKASMRLYQFLSLFTPIALSFIISLMFTLLTAFTSVLMPGVEAGLLGEIAQIPQQLMDLSYLLVVVASISVALLSAKAVDMTAKNTLWITVNMALASAGIAFSTQLTTILMKIMFGL